MKLKKESMKMENLGKKKGVIGSIILLLGVILIIVYMTSFRTFSVTFTLKIGAGIQTQEVRVGNKVVEPETPSETGYIFLGWYLNGEKYDFNTPVKSNLNLEAKWEKISDK